MPTQQTLNRFVARVVEGAHAEAIEEFYHPDASMQENFKAPRVGRDALAARERQILSRALSVRTQCVAPLFVAGDYVVIRWIFEFQWKNGTSSRMEELAYQRWQGEQVKEETFFYDPAQTVAK